MSRGHLLEGSREGTAAEQGRAGGAPRSPASGPRPVRGLAVLALLVGGLAISSLSRTDRARSEAPAPLRQVELVINGVSGEDLVWTRANPSQPQHPSPF